MKLFRPRTIRGQLILGLVLLEAIFLLLFAILLVLQERAGIKRRALTRMEYQSRLLAVEAGRSLANGHPEWLNEELSALLASRAILAVRITDMDGHILAEQTKAPGKLEWKITPFDHAKTNRTTYILPFSETGDRGEAISLITDSDKSLGYAWVMEDPSNDRAVVDSLLKNTLIFGMLALLGCVALSTILARSITRPLAMLMEATRRLIKDPESREGFPLHIRQTNEAAEVASAFNLLVGSMADQRAGLIDTLALLDSMLAHAPVGFAFFDREYHYVRVNRFLSDLSDVPVQEYLGHSIHDFLSPGPAGLLAEHIDQTFLKGEATRDLELTPESGDVRRGAERCWVVNLYPVRVGSDAIRWAGAVFIDATDRKRSEEALRKSEKLAATGRLAASIAHEINNPLESVTNLLYLLQRDPSLDTQARQFASLAEQEVARVAEMAQRTLRFYRQSTLPSDSNLSEVLDSVLMVHQGRFQSKHMQVGVPLRQRRPAVQFCRRVAAGVRQPDRQCARCIARGQQDEVDAAPLAGLAQRTARGCASPSPIPAAACRMRLRRRIFEPFYTTKDATGTGLGLWISSEILEKHGATIAVKSRTIEPDADAPSNGDARLRKSGTVFMLFFPEEGVARPCE